MKKKFVIPEDEYNIENKERESGKRNAQHIQEEQEVQEVQEEEKPNDRPYGCTQGKKGQHAKRINMAFSDRNHEFITRESRRQGLSATAFVNQIIDAYRKRGSTGK